MRPLFTFAFAVFVFISNAQITGKVKDTEGNPLSGVTISLLKDSAVVKLSVTKEDGLYNFAEITEGSYKISASHIGYSTTLTEPFTVNGQEVKLEDLQLTKATSNLSGVTVTARKPIIEVKADKMIVNVEGTINATGSDALELLRKSPGVLVDKDDNLSVSGKNGVQVYIDGRPTPLAGQDLAQFLRTMQSTEIEAIEIITNPSARYEAAGNAGIINIKLKKNKAFGTNGSVTAGLNIGVFPKYNTGISLNHRNNKINVFGNYNFNNSKNQNRMSLYRTVLDTLFDQQGKVINDMHSHNFKTGIDYFINKQSTIGAIVTGSFSSMDIKNNSSTPISYKPTNTVDRILEANNRSEMKRNNSTINLNYSFNSAKGKTLNLNGDYGYYDINSDQLQPNNYYSPSRQLLNSINYQMISPTKIHISSVKADYEQGLGKGKLGVGGKIAYINTDNDFGRYNLLSTGRELDKDRSNHFKYNENINAVYANYNRPFTGFMVQAGLRAEQTITEGKSTGLKFNGSDYENSVSGFKRSYVDLFPSAAITFNKNPMKQWNFTYSRRIDRPAYQDLNPFEFKLDEYTFQKGNINLRPQYTNSFGATYTYKYKLNTTLNYSHVKNMFTMLIDTAEKSKSFISKQNLATQDIVSLNISYPFMYKTFTSFINMNTNYSQYEADFGTGREVDLDAFALSIYSQNSFKFGKTKTWTAELTGFYNAPTIWQGAFRSKTIWGVDAGLQKQLFQGKGTVKASFSDIFNSLRFTGTMDFAGQTTRANMRWETQQLKLNFTYRFGSAQVKAARQRATGAEEESKRTQGGGGGIGINQ